MSDYASINREIFGNGSGAKLPPFRGDVERVAPARGWRRFRGAMLLVVAAVALLLVLLLGGCTADGVAAVKAQAVELRGQIDAADQVVAGVRETLAQAEATGDAGLVADTREALAKAEAVKADVAAKLDGFIAKTTEIDDAAGLLGAAVSSAAPALPPPYGLIAGLIGAGLAGYSESQRRKLKAAATDAIVAIERTKADDVVDFRVGADELRSRMSTEARAFVSEARDKAEPGRRTGERPLLIDIGSATPANADG